MVETKDVAGWGSGEPKAGLWDTLPAGCSVGASYSEGSMAMAMAASQPLQSWQGAGLWRQRCPFTIRCRPVCHMSNWDDPTDNVMVLLDEASEAISKAEIPLAHPEDEDESDEEEEGPPSPRQRRRLDSPSSSGRSGDEEGGGGDEVARERQRERRRKRSRRKADRERYYSVGVSYGKPAACLLYDLAYALQQENSHMLWLALIGLTDQLVHDRISSEWCGMGQLRGGDAGGGPAAAGAVWCTELPDVWQACSSCGHRTVACGSPTSSPACLFHPLPAPTCSFEPLPVLPYLAPPCLRPCSFSHLQVTSMTSTTFITRPMSPARGTWTCPPSARRPTATAPWCSTPPSCAASCRR